MTRHTYEIRVIGSFGPDAREAFADTKVQVEPAITPRRDRALVTQLLPCHYSLATQRKPRCEVDVSMG